MDIADIVTVEGAAELFLALTRIRSPDPTVIPDEDVRDLIRVSWRRATDAERLNTFKNVLAEYVFATLTGEIPVPVLGPGRRDRIRE